MRLRLISTAFAISLLPAAANAQVTIDMSAINCDQYLAMSPAMSRDFSAWMSGWFSYQTRRTFVDLALHQKNIANLKAWCQYHPQDSVMTGLAEWDWPAVKCCEQRGIAMRWNVLFVTATLLVAASLPSAAQISVDMNQMTCGDWLGYSPEEPGFRALLDERLLQCSRQQQHLGLRPPAKKFCKSCSLLQEATSPKPCRPQSRTAPTRPT